MDVDVEQTAVAADSSVEVMNNSSSVLLKIANLYAEQLMSDICLVVGQNRYPAHRVILCASSEVFQVMLMKPEWNECRERVIELKEEPLCASVFPHFLKYLYVGQIRISIPTVMPLLALADKYNIRDLVKLCTDYMEKHVSTAATQAYFVSWLHYAISLNPDHSRIANALQQFLKYNFEMVAQSKDFIDLDVNILVTLLQQNDLVVLHEFVLFEYAAIYLMKKIELTKASSLSEAGKLKNIMQFIEGIVTHIRFPMMTPNHLASILLTPLARYHQKFFVDRTAIGLAYHSSCINTARRIRRSQLGCLQFTPRLYKSDAYGLSMTIKHFHNLTPFQVCSASFFSHNSLSECKQDTDPSMQWHIDFYPRGIFYSKAQLISIFDMTGTLEIPESIVRTVRLSVRCTRHFFKEQRFKVGVLITATESNLNYIRTVHVHSHYFSSDNCVLNIDNLLPYDELEINSIKLSPYFIGKDRDRFTLQIIITPMCDLVCNETPKFEFI